MLITTLSRCLQLILVVAAQVLVCNHFHLLGYATPLVGPIFLLYFPLNANRSATLLWAFALGLAIDYLSGTPGQSSGAMTVAALEGPMNLTAFKPKEASGDLVGTYRQLGKGRHVAYVSSLPLVHTAVYVGLEYMSYFRWQDALITLSSSWAMTTLCLLTFDTMRDRRRRSEVPTE